MNFTTDVVIGLEIHVQLNTKTKLFCSCEVDTSAKPNTKCCPVCLGMPGSKPVLNQQVLNYAIKLSLALGCELAKTLNFSRKSYFYPDLAKNYQTTQYELPLGSNGSVQLSDSKVGITRAHIEEDPASLIHPTGMGSSTHVLMDYNRSGIPLVEVVTEPDMESPEQAREFLKELISMLRYLDIFDPKTCVIKADANISIKERDYKRVEIKNISGFKEIERALNYEIERQKNEEVELETRGWDADKGISYSMRKKEQEEEYGYIIDPDLIPIQVDDSVKLPELPRQKAKRFQEEYKLSSEDAKVLTQDPTLASLFEKTAKTTTPKLAVSWMRHEMNRVLNYNDLTLEDVQLDEEQIFKLVTLVKEKKITENVAKKILEKLIIEPFDVENYIEENKLAAVSDTGALKTWCEEVLTEQPASVEDYKSGNTNAMNFLMGQVMRKSRGAASAPDVMKMLKELLN